jgi:predicted nucleic acid-binding protein
LIVHLDTSILIHTLSAREHRGLLADAFERGDRLMLSTIVLFEWLRGPRTPEQRAEVNELFPADSTLPFQIDDAAAAARIYQSLPRARARQTDIMIAACAIEHGAALWTLNTADFEDIPGLTLYGI